MNSAIDAEESYAAWLRAQAGKHFWDDAFAARRRKMAADPFVFMRGSFFLWPSRFAVLGKEVTGAPAVLSVGDIHVENYGVWRDGESRLVWGINDFDEAQRLPYTCDLVRLAASARFADLGGIGTGRACDLILDGYRGGVDDRGSPYVLDGRHEWLRALVRSTAGMRAGFWPDDDAEERDEGTPGVRKAVLRALPKGAEIERVERDGKRGTGSLGRARYRVFATWQGAPIAREAKLALPPYFDGKAKGSLRAHREIEARAARARDPSFRLDGHWLIRRLTPEARKLDWDDVTRSGQVGALLETMGRELANAHHATPGLHGLVSDHLRGLDRRWLAEAAATVQRQLVRDYERFRRRWGD